MSDATPALGSSIITHLLRTGSWTKPATLFVGLFTALPNEDGSGGTEVVGTPYGRVAAGPGDTYWNAAGVSLRRFSFGRPTADWGLVVGWGLFAASTGGTPLVFRELATPVNVMNGSPAVVLEAGDIAITVT